MKLLTGEYNNTLDEKGRISFPVKLRTELDENVLVITRGLDCCLWLFTPEKWEIFKSKVMGSASPFSEKNRMVIRRIIAPAIPVEFDKTGRLSIPQTLREYAKLNKDCTILAIDTYMELWDMETYNSYLNDTEVSFLEAADELKAINF